MAVYDINGNPIQTIYNVDGEGIPNCYDINGNPLIIPTSIKVMTYNVGGWYEGTGTNVPANKKEAMYALQTGMIEDNDPDILIIQEYLANFSADGTSAYTMLQSLFPYVHVKTSGTYYGRAICSKYPITNYTEHYYTNDSNRYFDSCTITINGIPIKVVDTHLGLTPEDRSPQITELISYLSTLGRFLCGGDYNTPHSSLGTPIDKTEIQPFFTAGFYLANCSTLGDFITSENDPDPQTWKGWIDNICSSQNMIPVSAYVDESKLTAYSDGLIDKIDHMPFVVTYQVV